MGAAALLPESQWWMKIEERKESRPLIGFSAECFLQCFDFVGHVTFGAFNC